ncbi:TRAP transporter small permease [Flavimaricola marinus]|uniref:TRAP transporter small permease protein n=1 Tax=Flavimaricola marinus TaxID=1819565 RepID=A0A238LEB4_9RHOB|nr:TRAP transporter small permease [Flavimaricola marinus]SMY08047.1 Tripartite ATP-independent periplasmic transporters, DctQ component [Flavimaricola marinus]
MGGQIRAARVLHIVSAVWTLGLAFLVGADVLGRILFSSPIPGTKEILQNSVVTITFLQLPLAIYSGSMLRTSILSDALPPVLRRLLRTFAALLGCALFLALLWGTWPSFMDAYRIGEYEGEGSLRVPTWPVRGAIAAMSVFGMLAYAWMIVLDWRGQLLDELEAPGALARLDN